MKKPYIIVECLSIDGLVHLVNMLIDDGYEPIGGITIINTRSNYAQAMILNTALRGKV